MATSGRFIAGYELAEEIGRGGMGAVYRSFARDGRPVAVKVLLRDDAGAAARFDRERRLLATLGAAQGFVPLLDAGVPPGAPRPFIVMPLLEGGTLRDRL